MRASLRYLSASFGQRCEVLDEENRQWMSRTKYGDLPAQLLAGWCLTSAQERVADVDTALSHLHHVGFEVVTLHGNVAQSLTPRQKIEQPPARIAGEVLVPVAHAHETAAAVPNARLHVLEGDGSSHALPVERADEVNDLLRKFVDAHRGPAVTRAS